MPIDRSPIDDIEANLRTLEIDEIRERLRYLLKGISIDSPYFHPGAFLYRARKLNSDFRKGAGIKFSDLIYPPQHKTKLGRLNRDGQQIFYCSMNKQVVFFELQGLKPGDEIILSFWKTKERMVVNNIGYTDFVFQQLGAKRPRPEWKPTSASNSDSREVISRPKMPPKELAELLSHDEIREVRELFSEYFARAIGPTDTHRYKISVAIGELHLGKIHNSEHQFAGILYPAVRMWANGDNLALLSWFVDEHLEFRKATHIRIEECTETGFRITSLDSAREFDADGNLIWLGRLPTWTLNRPFQKAIFTPTRGVDEDGDYSADKDGQPWHWVVVDADTGTRIEAQ